MSNWICALQLDTKCKIVAGSEDALCEAIRHGADLRVRLASIHNEHIDRDSDNSDLIRESLGCPVTYLIDDRWSAGIMSDRVPISPLQGFNPRVSMSFFVFNQNGRQAIARPYLDGPPPDVPDKIGPAPFTANPTPKYNQYDAWDTDTNAPSHNFMYEFEYYHFQVCDCWEQLLSHDAAGRVISGSLDVLTRAVYEDGCDIKVGIRGLCNDLADNDSADHEVFVHLGSCYHYTDGRMLLGPSRTIVRVAPAVPLAYRSRGWDFGFALPRTDGVVSLSLCDPYTLKFRQTEGRYAVRWFVRR